MGLKLIARCHVKGILLMGTFAETAIIDYRLSFADLGKQTSVFRFCLQQTKGSWPFHLPLGPSSIYLCIYIYITHFTDIYNIYFPFSYTFVYI
jgi:hypothetical protein